MEWSDGPKRQPNKSMSIPRPNNSKDGNQNENDFSKKKGKKIASLSLKNALQNIFSHYYFILNFKNIKK